MRVLPNESVLHHYLSTPRRINPLKSPMPIDSDFAAALQAHSMEIDEPIAERLESYARILWNWNEQLNLTRHTSWDLFVGRDLRDCLQLAPLLETATLPAKRLCHVLCAELAIRSATSSRNASASGSTTSSSKRT